MPGPGSCRHHVVAAACALLLLLCPGAALGAPAAPSERSAPALASPRGAEVGAHASLFGVETVTIGGTRYWTGDLVSLGRRLSRGTAIRYVLSAISACRGAAAFGFVSISNRQFGVVAWIPASAAGCIGVSGGGPQSAGGTCLQGFSTPAYPDPTGVAGIPGPVPRHYVLFAGTGGTICQDISTQVPGGVWARTTASISGLAAGSRVLIKCQYSSRGALADYVTGYRPKLPASKPTFAIFDAHVATGATRLRNVPSCFGTAIA